MIQTAICEAKLNGFTVQMIGNLNCKHTKRKGVCACMEESYLSTDAMIFLPIDGKF